jgi:hypothetical protein
MKATTAVRATTSSKPMAQKATRVADTASDLDVLVGPSDGRSGYRRVEVRSAPGGGLAINVSVPAELARPVRQLVAALKAGRRL